MSKSRKTTTGTEGAPITSQGSMADLAKREGIATAVKPQGAAGDEISYVMGIDTPKSEGIATAVKPQDAVGSSEEPTPTPTPSDQRSAEGSDGAASESAVPKSAAPASTRKPEQPPAIKPKRSVREGAVKLEDFPNEYTGEDEEHMKTEVVVYALMSRRVSIGLKHWDLTAKCSYIVPRWYALSHKNLFVIQGE